MRRFVLPFVVGLALVTAPTGSARPGTVAAPPSLRQLAKNIVATGLPGAFVALRDGATTRAAAAGYANVRSKEPLGTGHAFRVGSVTKTFVATVVLQLAGENVLGLDDSVERWLPGLVPNGGAITLRQLLNHTSGIYNFTDDSKLIASFLRNPRAVWTPESLVALATSHPPLFAPGTGWSYSNTGFILLGLVVEKATGTPLGDELRRRIFEPLALTRTSLPADPGLPAPFAHGYLLPGNGLIPTPKGRPADVSIWSPSWAWAAGGIVSTADDLARFYSALLGGRLLRPDLLEAMETTRSIGPSDAYGLGLIRTTTRCGEAWGHTGGVPGYSTFAFSRKDGSRQVVLMVNASIESLRQAARISLAIDSAFCR